MSFAARLDRELAARGVRRGERTRIRLEFEDHAACGAGDGEALGDPAALARDFVNELAADGARRGARLAVGALALAAVALVASQLLAGGANAAADSHTVWALWLPGLIGIVVGPQVALVAGSLAALGAWHRRGERVLPAAAVTLIDSRAMTAVAGGLMATGGLTLFGLSFIGHEPARWVAPVAGTAALMTVALGALARRLHRNTVLAVTATGPAGDLSDELGLAAIGPAGARLATAMREHPVPLGFGLSAAVAILVLVVSGQAESSLAEGLQRGAFEGAAAAAGFVLLGRRLGLRR